MSFGMIIEYENGDSTKEYYNIFANILDKNSYLATFYLYPQNNHICDFRISKL